MLLLPCYLQLLGVDVGERDCGDESADAAVPSPSKTPYLRKPTLFKEKPFKKTL